MIDRKLVQSMLSGMQFKYVLSLLAAKFPQPYVIVKGEVLSYQAYGAPGRRHFGDVDILVDRKDLTAVTKVFHEDGFETNVLTREQEIVAKAFSHQIPPLWKKVNGVTVSVDINYDIFWGEWTGPRQNIAAWLKNRETIELFGLPVPILSVNEAFIQLCLHHYKDMNSLFHLTIGTPIKTEKFQDVYYFWHNNQKELSIEKICAWAESCCAQDYLYCILCQTAEVMQDEEIVRWGNQLNSNGYLAGNCLTDTYGLENGHLKKWEIALKERIDNPKLPEYVKARLSEEEKEKIERERIIFG